MAIEMTVSTVTSFHRAAQVSADIPQKVCVIKCPHLTGPRCKFCCKTWTGFKIRPEDTTYTVLQVESSASRKWLVCSGHPCAPEETAHGEEEAASRTYRGGRRHETSRCADAQRLRKLDGKCERKPHVYGVLEAEEYSSSFIRSTGTSHGSTLPSPFVPQIIPDFSSL